VKRFGSTFTCVGADWFYFYSQLPPRTAVRQSFHHQFRCVKVGSSASESVVLTNIASSNLTISQATLSGTGFTISGLGVPATLVPGQSVSLTQLCAAVRRQHHWHPLSGMFGSKIKTRGKALQPRTASNAFFHRYRASPGQLAANPSSLNFGNVQVAESLTLMDTLTNTGVRA